ncbi:MAG: hypothetical protein J6X86_05845 [Bacteroidales bacterium]|nr:hypothetical protein [Bacteroidales bacterium]
MYFERSNRLLYAGKCNTINYRLTMNEYIKNYIEERKRKISESNEQDFKEKVVRLATELEIGEKEYTEESGFACEGYPYYDGEKRRYYRYNLGDVTKEEYEQLLEYAPKKKATVKRAELSKWYVFAMVVLITNIIGLFVVVIAALASQDLVLLGCGIGEFFFVGLMCAVVQLLAGIKQKVDS